MSKISNLKLVRFGSLTMSQRVQPVNKTDPIFLNLYKEPEFKVSANLIDAIDHFIFNGLQSERTHEQLRKMIATAYDRYMAAIRSKLGITSGTAFEEYCLKRYQNGKHRVKICGVIVELEGVDLVQNFEAIG